MALKKKNTCTANQQSQDRSFLFECGQIFRRHGCGDQPHIDGRRRTKRENKDCECECVMYCKLNWNINKCYLWDVVSCEFILLSFMCMDLAICRDWYV